MSSSLTRSIASSQNTPTTSPASSPTRKTRLTMPGVANLFVRVRRLEMKALKPKPNQTIISSGDPKTHPVVSSNTAEQEGIPVARTDLYVCSGGVNVIPLLRATRSTMLDKVEALGGNALTEEHWECIISGPKPQHNGTYKVQVRYQATATKTAARDPHKPVALDKAGGIPGLMTILKRNEA